ncbi:class I SAM-dependent methyltransferase [Candidatus Bipolaricaulota sp. J31]
MGSVGTTSDRVRRHRYGTGGVPPPDPASVLDVGGGPGRYAIELSRRGYGVVLLDLSGECLALAREKAREAGVDLAGWEQGDARDLSRFADGRFDVVLLMGPLYHLLEEDGRRRAIREARRVLKPGGLLFASFITRYAPIRWAAKHEPNWITDHQERLEELLASGALRARPGGFTDAYFAHPLEIHPLLEGEGFQTLDLIACEGVVSMIEEGVNGLSGEAWEAWVRLNYRLGKDPTVHGAAEHLLYVGRAR